MPLGVAEISESTFAFNEEDRDNIELEVGSAESATI